MRKYIPSESIDLIYLDPPFNSNESYNVLFKSRDKQPNSQIIAFEDTWHWNQASEDAYDEVIQSGNAKAATAIEGLRQVLGESDMMAYLCMMCVRLLELHRVLKPRGSIYLHCDPTASHYLKIIMDAVFGVENFRNEIVWDRVRGLSSISKNFRKAHDIILRYAKTKEYQFTSQYMEKDEKYAKQFGKKDDIGYYTSAKLLGPGKTRDGETGKPWRGVDPNTHGKGGSHWIYKHEKLEELNRQGRVLWPKKEGGAPRVKYYLHESKGVKVSDVWTDVPAIESNSREYLDYQTQKPLILLERIIKSSSKKGQIVLDPFCGCGTAVHAAEKMQRRWIGIDITHLAINIMEDRMKSAFPGIKFRVDGLPQSMVDARKLFKLDPFQFELWAIQRIIPGMQVTSKTGDQGIDGVGRAPVGRDANGRTKYAKIIASVKGGKHIPPAYMNELQGNLAKHNADMGVLLTLEDLPKRSEIVKICTKAGKYTVDTVTGPMHYPILQTFKVGDVFEGRRPDLPSLMQSAAVAAPVIKRTRGTQSTLTD